MRSSDQFLSLLFIAAIVVFDQVLLRNYVSDIQICGNQTDSFSRNYNLFCSYVIIIHLLFVLTC